jgi:hypothetical protein
MPLTELKEGMNVSIGYRLHVTPYRMIAKVINVYKPRGGAPRRMEIVPIKSE